MNVMWFRGDLRVDDNRALASACRERDRPLIALYFLSQAQLEHYGVGLNQQYLLVESLKQLKVALNRLNIPLLVLSVDRTYDIPKHLVEFCKRYHVNQVFFNIEYPSDERFRDQQSTDRLLSENIKVSRFNDQTLVEPWRMVNQQGLGFKVFTPFSKSALIRLSESTDLSKTQPTLAPFHSDNLKQKCLGKNILNADDSEGFYGLSNAHPMLNISSLVDIAPDISEPSVHKQLAKFIENSIENYHNDRDFPAINGTSQLSSALALGSLSVRRCYQAAKIIQAETSNEGVGVWIKELLWRDFYRTIMWHYPHVCRREAFLPVDKAIEWNKNGELLLHWQKGTTGIPIVDAAIRQLLSTGWMHNRLRMIVASFLCKNLWYDWREGERFFAKHLFDYDFASNNGGWQWSASVGTDAAPYFRVFNPASQGARFDPNAEFIRKWIPELSNYSAKQIHNFERLKFEGYGSPIVDLKMTRKISIEQFKAAKESRPKR